MSQLPQIEMQIGTYEVPENRLVPNAISDTKKIYDVIKEAQIGTKEVGNVFGYKIHTTGVFYRRLTSLTAYGLLQQIGRSTYKVTDLGIGLCYPEPDKEQILKNKSILNVKLWRELFDKFGKSPPQDNFWIQLKNITGMAPVEAQKMQSQIRRWYLDDINLLTLDPLGHPIIGDDKLDNGSQTKTLSSSDTNNNTMPQQLAPQQQLPRSSSDEIIQFGKASLSLPKNDLRKQWEKLQKYMEIYLEDYQEESEDQKSTPSENQLEPNPVNLEETQ